MTKLEKVRALWHRFSAPWRESSWNERKERMFITMCFVVPFCLGFWWLKANYMFGIDSQVTKCIDGTVFFVKYSGRHLVARDDLIALVARNAEPVIHDGTLLAKYIRGVPGDTVTVTPDEKILVNGKEVGKGLPHLDGVSAEKRRKFYGTRVLGKDEFWVMGTNPVSFDSRYYGPVQRNQIRGKARILF